MKKARIIFMACILIIALCSCSSESSKTKKYNSMYDIAEINSNERIYVDSETNVMYWFDVQGYSGTLTLMVNADGIPKLYNSETSKYKVAEIDSYEKIYVDSETNVMYLFNIHNYGGGLTLMVNADGTPKLYNSKTCKYKVNKISSGNKIYVDSETDVMYWFNIHSYGGELTLMFNADGTPKLAN